MKLDHIGILVADAGEIIDKLHGLYGEKTEVETSGQDGFDSFFLKLGGSNIELLQPSDPSNHLFKRLHKTGGGLHHLSYETGDIQAYWRKCCGLFDQGIGDIEEVVIGENKFKYFFIHPSNIGGVLIEIHEKESGR